MIRFPTSSTPELSLPPEQSSTPPGEIREDPRPCPVPRNDVFPEVVPKDHPAEESRLQEVEKLLPTALQKG